MNKFIATILAMVVMAFATLAFASPASATGDDADNKKVTLCHATGSATNPYEKITISVNAFYNAGHINHKADIWEAFSYTNNKGDVVNVPKQGDTALLAFPDCVQPSVDQQIAVPAVTKVDRCGTLEDKVEAVRDDAKYTTVVGDRVGDSVTVTFTANNGFIFPGGKTVTVTVNFPNNDDCDLPETGGAATYNTTLGGLALAGAVMLGLGMMFTRKRI